MPKSPQSPRFARWSDLLSPAFCCVIGMMKRIGAAR